MDFCLSGWWYTLKEDLKKNRNFKENNGYEKEETGTQSFSSY